MLQSGLPNSDLLVFQGLQIQNRVPVTTLFADPPGTLEQASPESREDHRTQCKRSLTVGT